MPHAWPRYSPVGSKLSLKPNDCSQPVRYTPPRAAEPLPYVPFEEPGAPPPPPVVDPPVCFEPPPQPAAAATSTTTTSPIMRFRVPNMVASWSCADGRR